MKKEIIEKLNLEETDLTLGNSSSNNIKVYKYKDDYLMAKCNELGEPYNDIMVVNPILKTKVFVTEDMGMDISIGLFDKIISPNPPNKS